MFKDNNMLINFLKKENATISLMEMLEHFKIIKFAHRPFRTPENELWINRHNVKVFCAEWVKTNSEQ